MNNKNDLLCLGAGYTAQTMMKLYPAKKMWGTTRTTEKASAIEAVGATPVIFTGQTPSEELSPILREAENILISISPKLDGGPLLKHHQEDLLANKNLKWIGYLSTVGVYGNHDGEWVDEYAETRPGSDRSLWRKRTEDQWIALNKEQGIPVHIFRLPGIYGKGRGPLEKLKAGKARRINKEGQVFNRAHVEDIAMVLETSCHNPNPGAIYNIADDEPAPPQDVLAYAAELLGVEIPPLIEFKDAEMSKMAKSFYSDNKRVSNKRIKEELGIKLKYPTYREGIKACL